MLAGMGAIYSSLADAAKAAVDEFCATTGLPCEYSVVDQVDGLATTFRVRGKDGLQDLVFDNGQVQPITAEILRKIELFIDGTIVRRVSTESIDDFVAALRSEGYAAHHIMLDGQVGVTVGPEGLDPVRVDPNTTGYSFPLWELNEPQNLGLVARRDFCAIVERRPNTFSFVRK